MGSQPTEAWQTGVTHPAAWDSRANAAIGEKTNAGGHIRAARWLSDNAAFGWLSDPSVATLPRQYGI